MTRVYVIAAYTAAPEVRILHTRLRMAGHEPTSSWAEEATGAEDLTALSTAECRAIWSRNDRDMRDADVVIVLADTNTREGWMEAQRAVALGGVQIICIGRPTLTLRAWTDGVRIVADVEQALRALEVQP